MKNALLLLSVIFVTHIPVLSWGELTWAPGGEVGGDGIWEAGEALFLEDGELVAFRDGADLRFADAGGDVTVGGVFRAGQVSFDGAGSRLKFGHGDGARLEAGKIAGAGEFGFEGVIGAGTDAYPDLDTLRGSGLVLRAGEASEFGGHLMPLGGGSPVLRVAGDGGPVLFNGRWDSDSGSVIPWLVLEDGAHFQVGAEADMRFIKLGFYTLQLWVHGDGSGLLELAEDFEAERTEGGTQRLGIGSIRMGSGTLRTHASGNLPLGYRPQSDGSAQTNGHLVFENEDGLRWETRSNAQVYSGAVWIYRDMVLDTATDLMHIGVTEIANDYTAMNGWSVNRPVTLTKTGEADWILAGEAAFAEGSKVEVEAGRLVLRTDPASGSLRSGGQPGQTMDVRVGPEAGMVVEADAGMRNLEIRGEMVLAGELSFPADGFVDIKGESRTELLLGEAEGGSTVESGGLVFLAGELVVDRLPGLTVEAGTEWVVARGAVVMNDWELVDRSGLELRFVLNEGGTELRLVAGAGSSKVPGEVILEDEFDAEAGPWTDLSVVPEWGNPARHASAFEYVDGVVRLVRSGENDTSGYTRYNNGNGLKTFTALDHQFGEVIRHAEAEVTLDFRMRWPEVTAESGESGRVLILFNHDYPEGGLDLTPEGEAGSRIDDFSTEWWARPAYHVRLRNSTSGAGSSFLQYGGGPEELGEYEATDNWWLPGFVSGAGGLAPGNGDDFPVNSWVSTTGGVASDSLTLYRYRILPDRQELWRDQNGNGHLEPEELEAVMPLPAASEAPFYHYFEELEGLRIFWNGVGESGQAELDWLRLTVQENLTPVAEAGEDQFVEAVAEDRGVVWLDGGGSVDPEGEALWYSWWWQGERLAVSREAMVPVSLPEGEQEVRLRIRDAAGNEAEDTMRVTVSAGPVRPVAEAGSDQTVIAANEWFGVVDLDASQSFSPEGNLVRYRWSTLGGGRVLYDGAEASVEVALEEGSHAMSLTIWNDAGTSAEDSLLVVVEPETAGDAGELIYRENFSRPETGGEMGPDEVGWNLMQNNGEPVPEVKWDGNAHRSLSTRTNTYKEKVNADPDGTEYDAAGADGVMWMNQMPRLNVSPAEWMLWTDEFAIDLSMWELAEWRFDASDGSPWAELVAGALSVRIDGQWYVAWDLRQEINSSWWRSYGVELAATGWYLFEPEEGFTIREAEPVSRLPEGLVDAFGVYFHKEYAWYETKFDNFALTVRPQSGPKPYGRWLVDSWGAVDLAAEVDGAGWLPESDPDGDGVVNLWEYALNSDPTDGRGGYAGLRSAVDAEQWEVYLELPADSPASDLAFGLLRSEDLEQWEAVPTGAIERVADPETGAARWRATIPETGERWFFQWQPYFPE